MRRAIDIRRADREFVRMEEKTATEKTKRRVMTGALALAVASVFGRLAAGAGRMLTGRML